ncbi:MAG: thioesterase family protein [Paracoccaceae bacterium]
MNNKKNNFVIFQSNIQNVKKEWIDYNGHMNVAYYTLAFDHSLDDFLETILEIGPTFVKKEKQGPYSLQSNYHYLDELRLGDKFFSKIYIIDSDKKKVHIVLEMMDFKTKRQVAVCETLLINVDLNIRKSVNYGDHVIKKIEQYQAKCSEVKLPLQVGKNLKIIKK